MKIVITGASGFIGRHLYRSLENHGSIYLTGISRKFNNKLQHVENYYETPLADVLIHLSEEPNRHQVNVGGNKSFEESTMLMDHLLNKGFKKVLYCSSSVLYGDKGYIPYCESDPIEANDTYTEIKLLNENKVLEANGVVARISNIIGPNMSTDNVLSKIVEQTNVEGSIKLKSIKPIRDFLDVNDLVEALKKLIFKEVTGVYNIGTGKGTSIEKLVELVLKIRKIKDKQIKPIINDDHYSYNVLDNTKVIKETNWIANNNLLDSIKRIIKHE